MLHVGLMPSPEIYDAVLGVCRINPSDAMVQDLRKKLMSVGVCASLPSIISQEGLDECINVSKEHNAGKGMRQKGGGSAGYKMGDLVCLTDDPGPCVESIPEPSFLRKADSRGEPPVHTAPPPPPRSQLPDWRLSRQVDICQHIFEDEDVGMKSHFPRTRLSNGGGMHVGPAAKALADQSFRHLSSPALTAVQLKSLLDVMSQSSCAF